MNNQCKRILITPGEPAGIGPDITVQIAQHAFAHELIAIADPELLLQRAAQLHLPLSLEEVTWQASPTPQRAGKLKIIPITLDAVVTPGKLDINNAAYVINTLKQATQFCLNNRAAAIVTGPVHKGIINDAGISFSGHTEFFADCCNAPLTVMLFVVDQLKVALATTHLPLKAVATALTAEKLKQTLKIFHAGLKNLFHLEDPRILVAGLNPHAGENGHLGREEIDVIIPVLNALRTEGYQLEGPLPADTLFTAHHLNHADAVLAMYHDQALPLVKYIGFDRAVNVTLGLPFIRTSVDHGTALELAGTGKAKTNSLLAALQLASLLLTTK